MKFILDYTFTQKTPGTAVTTRKTTDFLKFPKLLAFYLPKKYPLGSFIV